MAGRDNVVPDDIMSIVPSILGHRTILSYEAILDKLNSRSIVSEIAREHLK